MNRIGRREFLGTSAAALAALAAACGGSKKNGPAQGDTLEEIIAGRTQNLVVIAGPTSFGEVLARPGERLPVALGKPPGGAETYSGGTGRLWIAQSRTSPVLGPFDLAWHDEGLGAGRGLYSARVTIPRDGQWLMLVEATPPGAGTLIAGSTLTVGRQLPQPIAGEKAISTKTPTDRDARGVDPICTRDPQCGLHALSLDEALANGKPTVLNIGTPRFCRSKICGPELDAVLTVHREVGDRINFVHVEVYKDDRDAPANNVLAPAAAAWKLEAEPVTYFIGADGTIADRFVSLAAADEIRVAANALL